MGKLPAKKAVREIPERVLRKFGAVVVRFNKGDTIFREGDSAQAFFIVRRGQVKMVNSGEDGREFVQGYFADGESFGEPPFFTEDRYPAAAISVIPSEIWSIGRKDFLRLLKDNFEIHLELTRALGLRLIYKSIMLSEIAIEEAEHRVRTLLKYLGENSKKEGTGVFPFSRQQLADMSGLRVETVIRTIKNLEMKKIVKLTKDGKILLD